MKLNEMTTEELKDLLGAIRKEIKSREGAGELVLYEHECKDKSSYHMGKCKHWAKLIQSVDATKTNGFAFLGKPLDVSTQHKVPAGSLIAEVCGTTLTIFSMTTEGKKELRSCNTKSMSETIDWVSRVIAGEDDASI